MHLTLACIQLTSGADMAANIAKVGELVAQAVGQGAQLVATPENTFLMEAPGCERVFYTQENHPGILAAKGWAKQFGVWLLIGSVAVEGPGGKTFNQSILFNPAGEIATHYDKIHLFDATLANGEAYTESARYLGGQRAMVADVANTKLGMSVCYDVRFPHLYRALAKQGAKILAVPSAFTQTTGEAHWHVLLRARAIENGCFVIAPAQTGTHPGGRKTFGHALIVDPWGKIIADAGTDEGIIVAEIDIALVAKTRALLPSLEHDREFSFCDRPANN